MGPPSDEEEEAHPCYPMSYRIFLYQSRLKDITLPLSVHQKSTLILWKGRAERVSVQEYLDLRNLNIDIKCSQPSCMPRDWTEAERKEGLCLLSHLGNMIYMILKLPDPVYEDCSIDPFWDGRVLERARDLHEEIRIKLKLSRPRYLGTMARPELWHSPPQENLGVCPVVSKSRGKFVLTPSRLTNSKLSVLSPQRENEPEERPSPVPANSTLSFIPLTKPTSDPENKEENQKTPDERIHIKMNISKDQTLDSVNPSENVLVVPEFCQLSPVVSLDHEVGPDPDPNLTPTPSDLELVSPSEFDLDHEVGPDPDPNPTPTPSDLEPVTPVDLDPDPKPGVDSDLELVSPAEFDLDHEVGPDPDPLDLLIALIVVPELD